MLVMAVGLGAAFVLGAAVIALRAGSTRRAS
jgi:hypothetical protein